MIVYRRTRGAYATPLAAFALLAVFALLPAAAAAPPPASPLSPDEALKHFQLDPACRIELAAAEPQVVDPVDIRFDEDGRMWVAEMRDYPHGPPKGEPGQSQIKVLEDRDGDGRYETATVFADKLLFVTGLQPWKGGVFVTLAGRVAYMKDTDGDGRADVDETWFTGFAQENSQLRANHPRLALDNHIYIANGLRGGKVVDARKPGSKPIDISGMDFRFNPLHVAESLRDSKAGLGETGPRAEAGTYFEAVSGNGQFGLTFDDYGNRFTCTNRNPLIHVVLEQRYLKQNPAVAVPSVVQDVAKAGDESRVFPISRAWTTSNLHAGTFTAACGVEIYRGDALGKDAEGREFYGNAFTCDPTGNLVHREIVKPAGATFTSERAYKDREFLASTDEWFRPVNLTLGPDGALYVVDMYRAVIEHPDFVPDELKKRPDLMLGNDRGRIWRIVAKEASNAEKPASGRRKPADKKRQQLSKATSEDLVKLLEHPNAWWRETAQRLLSERRDASVVKTLKAISINQGPVESQIARIHALNTLAGLRSLDENTVLIASEFGRLAPRVEEQTLVMAEMFPKVRRLALRKHTAVPSLPRKIGQFDQRVYFHAWLTSSFAEEEEEPIWLMFAALHGFGEFPSDDPWCRHALVLSLRSKAATFLGGLLPTSSKEKPTRLTEHDFLLAMELAALVRADEPGDLSKILSGLEDLPTRTPEERLYLVVLNSMAKASARRSVSLFAAVEKHPNEKVRRHGLALVDRAAKVAQDASAPLPNRVTAIDLLALLPAGTEPLSHLALTESTTLTRTAAIAALARHADIEPWKRLLAAYTRQSPEIRRAISDGALVRTDRAVLLLDEVSAGRIKPAELDRAHLDRLLKHSDAKIRERAANLLADAIPADRQKVLADYQVVLKMAGDAKRGIESFKKNCAACHRIGEIGVNVAPDISDSRVKTAAQILTDILQPNRAIDANYVSYSVQTADGRQLIGIIIAETATSVTLKQQEGKIATLLRSEIERMQSNGVSLMPEGLEKTIPPQEMADLVTFIKNWRYLDGKTPLGK